MRQQLFRQLPNADISAETIRGFMQNGSTSATLYAVTTADSRIIVTDDRAVAVVAQDPTAAASLLAFTPIGRCRPYLHSLRRFVLGAYLLGGNYDALTESYGGEYRRVSRDWLERAIEAVGDADTRRALLRRDTSVVAKRALDSLLTCINRVDTFATAGNGKNGTPIPWCAAIIAAVACRIVTGRKPCCMPRVAGFNISLDPFEETES
jgi:hypothetical protein